MIDIAKATALILGIIGIFIRIQAVNFLVFRFLREGVQTTCAQVDLITDLSGVDNRQLGLAVPRCIFLGSDLDTTDQAQRIGHSLIDRLGLLDPVQGQCQGVGCLVKLRIGQCKVFIDQLQFAVIHLYIGIKADHGFYFRHCANTLSQLQQEAPCRCVLHIRAGQHVDQILKTLRNGDLGHVNGEHIGCHHIFGLVYNDITNCIIARCVGHFTVPCKLTVTASRLVKVKGVFTLLKQIQGNAATYTVIAGQRGCNYNHLNTGCFVANETEFIHHTGGAVTHGKYHIRRTNGHFLAFIECLDGQINGLTKNGIDVLLHKVHMTGHNNMNGLAANDFIAQFQVNIHVAISQGRDLTVGSNGCPSGVGNCPSNTLRQVCCIAGSADAGRYDLHLATNSNVICGSGQNRMIKCCGTGRSRHHEQRGTNRTFNTIRGSVYNTQFVCTFLLGNKCGRAAAVKVDRMDTTGFQHNLRNFLHAAAARPGFLTTIENHKDDLTGLGNTDGCTACTVSVIIISSGDTNFTIFNQGRTETGNAFCNLILINCQIFFLCTDHRCAILQNTKETAAVDILIHHTIHNQQTAGFTGGHIKTGTIDACDYIVVRNIVRTIGIAVFSLGSICLITNTLHRPTCSGIVIVIVCKNMDIVSTQVCSSQVIDHLLSVCRSCHFDLLCDAGSQYRTGRREHRIIGVLNNIYKVACQFADIICKRIAASLLEFIQIV